MQPKQMKIAFALILISAIILCSGAAPKVKGQLHSRGKKDLLGSLLNFPVSLLPNITVSLTSSLLTDVSLVLNNIPILSYLNQIPIFSTLNSVVNELTSLKVLLSSNETSVLVFAPTNVAFSNLLIANSTGLFPSINETLSSLITVTDQVFVLTSTLPFLGNQVETIFQSLSGAILRVDNYTLQTSLGLNSVVTVNGVPLLNESFSFKNGLLIPIDHILLPTLGELTTVVASVSNLGQFSALIQRASSYVIDILNSESVTLLAPVDSALANFDQLLVGIGLDISTVDQTVVDAIILNHIINLPFSLFTVAVSGNVVVNSSLSLLQLPTNLIGTTLSSTISIASSLNSVVTVTSQFVSAQLVASLQDVAVANGVFHAVDNLLFPVSYLLALAGGLKK